jgi:alpha-tubulin suppressor-like RCC1 family protein
MKYHNFVNAGYLHKLKFKDVKRIAITRGGETAYSVVNTFILLKNGYLYGVGYNNYRSLGVTTSAATQPTFILITTGVSDIRSGSVNGSMICLKNKRPYTSGYNNYGELGRSRTAGSDTYSSGALAVAPITNVVQVEMASGSTFCLLENGTVNSFGRNSEGQLGKAVTNGGATAMNTGLIPNLTDVIKVSAGFYHTLFLLADGRVASCGYNSYGQLGRVIANGSATIVNLSIIPDLYNVVDIAAGGYNSFFIHRDGTFSCCGYNTSMCLGDDTAAGNNTTINLHKCEDEFVLNKKIKSISAAYQCTGFLFENGNAYLRGISLSGIVNTAGVWTQLAVPNISQIELGMSSTPTYTPLVVARENGDVWVGGRNQNYSIGLPTSGSQSPMTAIGYNIN